MLASFPIQNWMVERAGFLHAVKLECGKAWVFACCQVIKNWRVGRHGYNANLVLGDHAQKDIHSFPLFCFTRDRIEAS